MAGEKLGRPTYAMDVWYGGRTQSTVWEVPNLNAIGGSRTGANTPTGHATQKPVRVFEILERLTNVPLDLHHDLQRLDPIYVEVAR